MIANAGQDATTQFEDINHPDSALDLLPGLCIGKYDSGIPDDGGQAKQHKHGGDDGGMITQLLLAVFFLALVGGLYFKLTQEGSHNM